MLIAQNRQTPSMKQGDASHKHRARNVADDKDAHAVSEGFFAFFFFNNLKIGNSFFCSSFSMRESIKYKIKYKRCLNKNISFIYVQK